MLDPYRNQEHDVLEALDHATDGGAIGSMDPADWTIKRAVSVPVAEVLNYDDYSSWGEWEVGELQELDRDELEAELKSFRGDDWAQRALAWLDDGIPAVVVTLDDAAFEGVSDGRGRLSFAVGMGIENVPVVWVTKKPTESLPRLKAKLLR